MFCQKKNNFCSFFCCHTIKQCCFAFLRKFPWRQREQKKLFAKLNLFRYLTALVSHRELEQMEAKVNLPLPGSTARDNLQRPKLTQLNYCMTTSLFRYFFQVFFNQNVINVKELKQALPSTCPFYLSYVLVADLVSLLLHFVIIWFNNQASRRIGR